MTAHTHQKKNTRKRRIQHLNEKKNSPPLCPKTLENGVFGPRLLYSLHCEHRLKTSGPQWRKYLPGGCIINACICFFFPKEMIITELMKDIDIIYCYVRGDR